MFYAIFPFLLSYQTGSLFLGPTEVAYFSSYNTNIYMKVINKNHKKFWKNLHKKGPLKVKT